MGFYLRNIPTVCHSRRRILHYGWSSLLFTSGAFIELTWACISKAMSLKTRFSVLSTNFNVAFHRHTYTVIVLQPSYLNIHKTSKNYEEVVSVRLNFLPQEVLGRFQWVMMLGACAKICWTRSLFLIFFIYNFKFLELKPQLSVLFQRMRQFQSPFKL